MIGGLRRHLCLNHRTLTCPASASMAELSRRERSLTRFRRAALRLLRLRATLGRVCQQEETMLHAVFTFLLLCFLFSSTATSGPLTKDIEVNGVRLAYVEEGSGETIVFIHGAVSDLRTWDVIREEVAKKYRFVAYTQRYFGTG